MNEKEVDTTIPESMQTKLFDLTGQKEGGSKGYTLFYVNESGEISVLTKTQNMCINLGLLRAIEVFIKSENKRVTE